MCPSCIRGAAGVCFAQARSKGLHMQRSAAANVLADVQSLRACMCATLHQACSGRQVEDEELSLEEAKERKIMKLLLKVKNGTPPQRKSALRQLTDKAREFGAGPLFNQILPLLMSPTLEDQERHLLVKVRPGWRVLPFTAPCGMPVVS